MELIPISVSVLHLTLILPVLLFLGNVVCLLRLLYMYNWALDYCFIVTNNMKPDQTASLGSRLILFRIVFKIDYMYQNERAEDSCHDWHFKR